MFHVIIGNGTLPAQPFFCLLYCGLLEKTLYESSKIFIEHAPHVTGIELWTQT